MAEGFSLIATQLPVGTAAVAACRLSITHTNTGAGYARMGTCHAPPPAPAARHALVRPIRPTTVGQWQKWKQQNLHHQVSFWAEVGMHSTTDNTHTHTYTDSCLLVCVCVRASVYLHLGVSQWIFMFVCCCSWATCFVSFAHWQNYKLRILRAPTTLPLQIPSPPPLRCPNPSRHCLRCQRIEVHCRPNQVCNVELLSYCGSPKAFRERHLHATS